MISSRDAEKAFEQIPTSIRDRSIISKQTRHKRKLPHPDKSHL